MRRFVVRVGIVTAAALFVMMIGLMTLMFLEDVWLASEELPAGVVCTLVGEPGPRPQVTPR